MNVALLIIRDGRPCEEECLASVAEMVPETAARIVINDSAHTLGFAGAIQRGWEKVIDCGAKWVFHVEADFIFKEPVPLPEMAAELMQRTRLAQIALKRQPVNDQEQAAGGIVEMDPDSYREEGPLTIHRRCFTTNPSLYPASLCHRRWPQIPNSEGVFTHELLDDGWQFAFWGGKFDPPVVEHVGQRAGVGY